MSSIVHAPLPSRPLVRLRDAIGHCRRAGIAVKIGPCNVVRVGLHWEIAADANTISPIGAALIAWQPPLDDEVLAAALAIGCSETMLTGILDGLSRAEPAEGWLLTGLQRGYREGYEAGSQLRVELLAPAGALRVAILEARAARRAVVS